MQLIHESFCNLSRQNDMSDYMIINQANRICIDCGLNKVNIKITGDADIKAEARSAVFGEKQILLTKGVFNLPWEEIAAIVGHEIIHLKNNDGTKFDWIKRLALSLLLLIVLFIMLVTMLVFVKIPYIGILLSFVFFPVITIYALFLFFLTIIDSRRFWFQLRELRADRLACELNGVSRQGMANLLKRLHKEYPDVSAVPWYEKYYYRYFLLVAHPCLPRRIFLIEKYRKWLVLDYLLHFFIMIKWFMTGKGWNGN